MYIQRNKPIDSKTGKEYSSVILCLKYRQGTRTVADEITNSDLK